MERVSKFLKISNYSLLLSIMLVYLTFLIYWCLFSKEYVCDTNIPLRLFNDNFFAKPIVSSGYYENPREFKNWTGLPSIISIFKWKFLEKDDSAIPSDENILDHEIPVHPLTNFKSSSNKPLFASWLGHSTVLVNVEGLNLITDPIWAHRASFSNVVGPKRYRPPPMSYDDLPQIDIGVISHDHYDHLDEVAVLEITRRNPHIRWFVPLGMKAWFEESGIVNDSENTNRVTEMNWGDYANFYYNGKRYEIWCLPAQHWGRRGIFDQNKRLWAGWALIGEKKKFYYTGDTGFCEPEFQKIGQKLGPFDLSAIPIGAYEPNWFMKPQHINPEEAVLIHDIVKSRKSIGVHWGTYPMGSNENYLEPRNKILEIMANRNDSSFIILEMGKIWEEE